MKVSVFGKQDCDACKAALEKIKADLSTKTWLTRAGGSAAIVFGFMMFFSVFASLLYRIPVLGSIVQGGVFLVQGIEGQQLGQMLGAYCPTILFPYAREAIDGIVSKGSFPALMAAIRAAGVGQPDDRHRRRSRYRHHRRGSSPLHPRQPRFPIPRCRSARRRQAPGQSHRPLAATNAGRAVPS